MLAFINPGQLQTSQQLEANPLPITQIASSDKNPSFRTLINAIRNPKNSAKSKEESVSETPDTQESGQISGLEVTGNQIVPSFSPNTPIEVQIQILNSVEQTFSHIGDNVQSLKGVEFKTEKKANGKFVLVGIKNKLKITFTPEQLKAIKKQAEDIEAHNH
jgi:nitrate reductase NapAB chaperone NapD